MIPPRTKLKVLCSSYAMKPTPPSFSAAVFGVPFGYPRAAAVRALLSRGFLQLGMQQKIDLPSLPFPSLVSRLHTRIVFALFPKTSCCRAVCRLRSLRPFGCPGCPGYSPYPVGIRTWTLTVRVGPASPARLS